MSEAKVQYCVSCGNSLTADAAFCTECGHQIGAPVAAAAVSVPLPNPIGMGCGSCGGQGQYLAPEQVYCQECRWLRPLSDEYFLELDAFMWQMDAQAMAVLNNLGPLASAAHSIAERYGRPVFEAATNGIRLSERQMPEIFEIAVRAARMMSLPHMPEVYISGERMWDVFSLGGFNGSFISIGSVLINFKPDDLLFLIAREMGHVRAGHVYWSTAMQFLRGKTAGQATILGEGILQFLNPAKLLESAIDAPLMRWARHSEITADRAATLVTGDLDCARRVLTQWAMKSFPVTGKLNLDAWLEQEAAADDPMLQMSEWTMSTTPYLAPRLKILSEYHSGDGFDEWRAYIQHWSDHAGLEPAEGSDKPKPPPPAPPPNTTGLTCAACQGPMRVPDAILSPDKAVNVRCPNAQCRKVNRVKPKAAPATKKKPAIKRSAMAKLRCVACQEAMHVERALLTGTEPVNVRCPNSACGEVLSIKPKAAPQTSSKPAPDRLSD